MRIDFLDRETNCPDCLTVNGQQLLQIFAFNVGDEGGWPTLLSLALTPAQEEHPGFEGHSFWCVGYEGRKRRPRMSLLQVRGGGGWGRAENLGQPLAVFTSIPRGKKSALATKVSPFSRPISQSGYPTLDRSTGKCGFEISMTVPVSYQTRCNRCFLPKAIRAHSCRT